MSGPFKMKGHSLPGPNQASPAKQEDLQEKNKRLGRPYKKTALESARHHREVTPSSQTTKGKKTVSSKTQEYVDYVDTKTDNKPKTPRDKYGNVIKT
tara:strand:+ start:629 stop:919 length:291 start_codon:yes stop_codon:yes gene_type:complete